MCNTFILIERKKMDTRTRKILNRQWRGRSYRWGGAHFKTKQREIFATLF
jgi:hypothetical protein